MSTRENKKSRKIHTPTTTTAVKAANALEMSHSRRTCVWQTNSMSIECAHTNIRAHQYTRLRIEAAVEWQTLTHSHTVRRNTWKRQNDVHCHSILHVFFSHSTNHFLSHFVQWEMLCMTLLLSYHVRFISIEHVSSVEITEITTDDLNWEFVIIRIYSRYDS